MEELVGTQGLVFEEADDVAISAYRFRSAGVGFSDLMISAAAEIFAANPVYTFDQKAGQLDGML